MKITFLMTGKTEEAYLQEGILQYEKRIRHYIPFTGLMLSFPKASKNLAVPELKELEGALLLRQIKPEDTVVLLDERGTALSSVEFAAFLQKMMNAGTRNCIFVCGGPYGFDDKVYARSDERISLSKMTFTHQIVRLVFLEQLYRAMTILRNEPYHH
jgi:23S rRNA (pseudouridine1915-N3)-methyltransferase